MTTRAGLELFVSRLSFYTNLEELKKLFSPFGVITQARLVFDQETQRPKGFGFVRFHSDADAQKALRALNGRIVRGKPIIVEVAHSSRPLSSST